MDSLQPLGQTILTSAWTCQGPQQDPRRSKESGADRSGVERVEGGGYGEPSLSRGGPGRLGLRGGAMGKLRYAWARGRAHLLGT